MLLHHRPLLRILFSVSTSEIDYLYENLLNVSVATAFIGLLLGFLLGASTAYCSKVHAKYKSQEENSESTANISS